MINYKFVEYDYKKLNPGGIVNLLYKVYPSGAKWAVGYYRTRCEAEIEINYLESAEKYARNRTDILVLKTIR